MRISKRDLLFVFLVIGACIVLNGCGQSSTSPGGESSTNTGGESSTNTGEESSIAVALDQAFRQSSRLDRIHGLTTTFARLDATNIDEAVGVYEVEFWWLGDEEIEHFMEAWARFDATAALEYASRWPERSRQPTALAAVIRAWALRDPQAAKAAIETLVATSPKQRSLFTENLLAGWVQSGQPGLVEYIASRPESSFALSTVWVAGGQTRRLGVPAVLDWLDGHLASDLPEKLKLNLVRRVTGMAARLDPARVAVWLETHEGQAYTDRAPTILCERWVAVDAETAIDWAAESFPEEERISMLRSAFTKWVTSNYQDAGVWIETVPTAKDYDPAFRAYAQVTAQRDPVGAIPWAKRIVSEESRQTVLTRVASAWYRRDAEAAEDWLQLSELDEEMRIQVREAPGRKRTRPLRQP